MNFGLEIKGEEHQKGNNNNAMGEATPNYVTMGGQSIRGEEKGGIVFRPLGRPTEGGKKEKRRQLRPITF